MQPTLPGYTLHPPPLCCTPPPLTGYSSTGSRTVQISTVLVPALPSYSSTGPHHNPHHHTPTSNHLLSPVLHPPAPPNPSPHPHSPHPTPLLLQSLPQPPPLPIPPTQHPPPAKKHIFSFHAVALEIQFSIVSINLDTRATCVFSKQTANAICTMPRREAAMTAFVRTRMIRPHMQSVCSSMFIQCLTRLVVPATCAIVLMFVKIHFSFNLVSCTHLQLAHFFPCVAATQ